MRDSRGYIIFVFGSKRLLRCSTSAAGGVLGQAEAMTAGRGEVSAVMTCDGNRAHHDLGAEQPNCAG
jgi:hypothetical protein